MQMTSKQTGARPDRSTNLNNDIAAVIASLDQRLDTYGKIELDRAQSESLLTCLRKLGELMWGMKLVLEQVTKVNDETK